MLNLFYFDFGKDVIFIFMFINKIDSFVSKMCLALVLLFASVGVFAQTPTKLNDGVKVGNQGVSMEKLKQLEEAIAKKKYERLSSVLIAKDGKLVYEKYYNGFDVNSQHDTRSATKTITSILIGIAIDKGFIKSEKEPILKYFADKKPLRNPDPRKEKITIEDLLTMSSILECDDTNQASRGHEERMYIIEDYFKFFLDLPIRGKPPWETDVKDLPYGRRFSYCTAGTVLLGGIIERSTKMKVEDFAQKYLFTPLRISKPKWQIIPSGTAMTGGGLKLKARDYIKLGQLFLSSGKLNGKQIVSSEWVAKSVKPRADTGSEIKYGYLWWLLKFGQKGEKHFAYAMFGNGGNKIAVFPKLKVVVVLTNRMYGGRRGHQQTNKIMNEYIVPALLVKKMN